MCVAAVVRHAFCVSDVGQLSAYNLFIAVSTSVWSRIDRGAGLLRAFNLQLVRARVFASLRRYALHAGCHIAGLLLPLPCRRHTARQSALASLASHRAGLLTSFAAATRSTQRGDALAFP